ncbi:hypothetical protein K488DRAFT_85390 [Vararia minispora EC-137]|uniref:Uncharacterized protein n=1 Tax=Vararia minispora EC-137 TaxID=1314806 RepID=A0ACB8QN45_9AGAM|nr:hypothetical protein K488DRAFT_85390 [Vararia minispora EC-137]
METFVYESYSSYSDASSGPRTPSPQASLPHSPANFKVDIEPFPVKPVFIADPVGDSDHQGGIAPETLSHWQPTHVSYHAAPGSLLGELYEHDLPVHEQPAPDASYVYAHPLPQRVQHLQQDAGPIRRATYPYVRQEREDLAHYNIPPFLPADDRRPQHVYAEPHPMLDHAPQQLISLYEHSSSPAQAYRDLEPRVKLEDVGSPAVLPAQLLYRAQSMDHMQHHQLPILPHPSYPIQFTDDAASKETQTLRRRCTNCSQTEPPSWRRSTLNPGKIVCNKCGLYERTHLRPRPLRFDELRTGNKSRKGKKAAVVKNEQEAAPIVRRTSVSSAHSSDWDDSLSASSGSSAPSSSFNSPSPANFALPLDRNSHSPTLLPNDGGIRLPNVDIASLSMQGSPQPAAEFALQSNEYFAPQNPVAPLTGSPSHLQRGDLPEVAWQQLPGDALSAERRGPSILRKTVVV